MDAPDSSKTLDEVTDVCQSFYKSDNQSVKILDFIPTPHRAVMSLHHSGIIIEIELGKRTEGVEDRFRLWRCKVRSGSIIGICDSQRKVVAREMACKAFLESFRAEFPLSKIPNFFVPKEIFVDPRIYKLIVEIAEEEGVNVHHQIEVNRNNKKGNLKTSTFGNCSNYQYTCRYFVGKRNVSASNRFLEYAKINAALKTYELLTGTDFPRTEYFTGEDCTDDDDEYEYMESEFLQYLSDHQEIKMEDCSVADDE